VKAGGVFSASGPPREGITLNGETGAACLEPLSMKLVFTAYSTEEIHAFGYGYRGFDRRWGAVVVDQHLHPNAGHD
jgi:hypothetical protein